VNAKENMALLKAGFSADWWDCEEFFTVVSLSFFLAHEIKFRSIISFQKFWKYRSSLAFETKVFEICAGGPERNAKLRSRKGPGSRSGRKRRNKDWRRRRNRTPRGDRRVLFVFILEML